MKKNNKVASLTGKQIIYKAHRYFDDFNYRIKNITELNFNKFFDCAIQTINGLNNMNDYKKACLELSFCIIYFLDIQFGIENWPDTWYAMRYKGKTSFSCFDNDTYGGFFLSNAYFGNEKNIVCSSRVIGHKIIPMRYKKKRYTFNFKDKEKLPYLLLNEDKNIEIYRPAINDKLLARVKYDSEKGCYLEDNITNFNIIEINGLISILTIEEYEKYLKCQDFSQVNPFAFIDTIYINPYLNKFISNMQLYKNVNTSTLLILISLVVAILLVRDNSNIPYEPLEEEQEDKEIEENMN